MTTDNILAFFKLVQTDLSGKDQETILKEFFNTSELEKISQRLEILRLINQGKTQRYIAGKLKCSVTTVSRLAVDYKDSEILKKLVFL
jgi:Trp operon repressor